MNSKSLLNIAANKLKQANIENPYFEAELLLSHITKIPKDFFLINSIEINKDIKNKFLQLIEKRKQHYPLQYLLGEWEFWSFQLLVGNGVFIPRPETESLIELVLENKHLNFASIIDIGTGSGNIAIALAKELQKIKIFAIDISETALSYAKKNAEINKVDDKIIFIQSNLLEGLNLKNLPKPILIISNPPYIAPSEVYNLQEEIKIYEPPSAYLANKDGLEYYERIAAQIRNFNIQHLYLLFEIVPERLNKIIEILNDFDLLQIKRDLSGLPRAALWFYEGGIVSG